MIHEMIHLLCSVVTQVNPGSGWERSTHEWIPRSRGHWGPPWRPPVTPTRLLFSWGQKLPQSLLAGSSSSPFCVCGLVELTWAPEQDKWCVLDSQLVPSLGHHDWVTGRRVSKLIWCESILAFLRGYDGNQKLLAAVFATVGKILTPNHDSTVEKWRAGETSRSWYHLSSWIQFSLPSFFFWTTQFCELRNSFCDLSQFVTGLLSVRVLSPDKPCCLIDC